MLKWIHIISLRYDDFKECMQNSFITNYADIQYYMKNNPITVYASYTDFEYQI